MRELRCPGLHTTAGAEEGVRLIERIREALIEGRDEEVARLTRKALQAGESAGQLSGCALIAAMDIVGERFRKREIFLPEVLLSARAMHAGMEVLRPHLEGEEAAPRGTVIIGTVEGDIHDIGKNLVAILLRGAGCRVIDLGKNVAPAAFVKAAGENPGAVVGLSALLITTMPAMARVVTALRDSGLEGSRIMIGGAPVSVSYAEQIGADGYGPDAAGAVELVNGWLT